MPVAINFLYARLSDLLEQTGETAWIVDLCEYKKQCRSFSRSFQQYYPASFLSHSYKTNYLETLCAAADEEGLYAEVVSAMEYELATAYGIDTSRIILNGPIKEDDLLIKALVGGSMINLDSVQEAQRLIALAERLPGTSYSVGVRCNFPLPDGAGSRFGIAVGDDDLDEVAELLSKSKKLRLTGIHCHFSAARSLQDFRWRIENMLCVSDHLFSDSQNPARPNR
jgi:diaminopimelate decarboxylase